jgi:hypothetical protein
VTAFRGSSRYQLMSDRLRSLTRILFWTAAIAALVGFALSH